MPAPKFRRSTLIPPDQTYARRLLVLFGLVYFAQGICQHDALAAQPLKYFLKEALGFDPARTTEFLAILTVPWTIKPVYGLISDYVPILGYRRKTWLLASNALASLGLLWLAGATDPRAVLLTLMLTAVGTAATDVIIDAVMVENGRETGLTAEFQSVQWLWINIALVLSSLIGGYLCTVLQPGTALQVAALIALIAPLTVMVASWMVMRERKSSVDIAEMKATTTALFQSFRSRSLWAVLAFIAFWNFSPGFGTPWYYHMTDTLLFSQGFIGTLGACEAVGGVIGALAYRSRFAGRPLQQQLTFGIWSGTLGTISCLLLLTPSGFSQIIAVVISVVAGAATTIALLATLTLAARACPAKTEAFTFAALMSITNGVKQVSQIIGARLYTDVFAKSMLPMILVSAAFTFACFLLLPMLRRAEVEHR